MRGNLSGRRGTKRKDEPLVTLTFFLVSAILFMLICGLVIVLILGSVKGLVEKFPAEEGWGGNYTLPSLSRSIAPTKLSTDGFRKVDDVTVDFLNDEAVVNLRCGCYVLRGVVEKSQGVSITNALRNRTGPRAISHDFIRDVFNTLGIKVHMVKIVGIKDRMYLARIFLQQGNTLLDFDIRPSDGMAVALRMGAPIYVNETLLETHGRKVC